MKNSNFFLKSFLSFLLILGLFSTHTGIAQDTDLDSVDNIDDLDDDNDGILDSDECPPVIGSFDTTGDAVLHSGSYSNSEGTNLDFTLTSTAVIATNPFTPFVFRQNTPGVTEGLMVTWNQHGDEGTSDTGPDQSLMTLQLDLTAVQRGSLQSIRVGSRAPGSTFSAQNGPKDIILTWTSGGNGILYDPLNEISNFNDGDIIVSGDSFNMPTTGNPINESEWYLEIDLATATLPMTIEYEAVGNPTGMRFEGFAFTPMVTCDFDEDGIPNQIDLDSDNDGCADALEGDGGISSSDLNSDGSINTTTNPVNDNGIPVGPGTAGNGTTGQANISATDPTISGGQCDDDGDGISNTNDNCDGGDDTTDNDADSVPDHCDFDDDNDGILDVYECRPNYTVWDDSTSESANVIGAIQGIQITATNDSNIRNPRIRSTLPTFPGNAGLHVSADRISSVDIFDMTASNTATHTYTFDTPLPNNIYAHFTSMDVDLTVTGGTIISLVNGTGLGSNTFTIDDNAETNGGGFSVLIPAGTTVFSAQKGAGGDNYFMTFSSICEDFDNDGIPNIFDLDSDNDGIPDVVEVQPTDSYVAPGAVNTSSGVPIFGSDTDGIDIGDFVNTDGDSNFDFLDTDSDNDGIFDIIEAGYGANDTSLDGTTNNPVGANGYDDTLNSTDDYTDQDGPVDDPTTLPNNQVTTTPEVDYKEQSQPLDSDGDGVADNVDIDNDNDGIPDAIECGNPNAEGNSDDSTGEFAEELAFIEWVGDFTDGIDIGDTLTQTLTDGSSITLTVIAANAGAKSFVPNNISTFPGALLQTEYDDDDNNYELYVQDTDRGAELNVTFQVIGALANGTNFSPAVVFTDGERTDSGETNSAVTNGSPWSLIDEVAYSGAGPTITGLGTAFITFEDTDLGVPMVRSDNVSELTFKTSDIIGNNTGRQGLTIGFLTFADKDQDGVIDCYDRDSDNDGISDAYEAGGTDDDSDGIIDNFIDADGDGLNDAQDNIDNGNAGEVSDGTPLPLTNTDSNGSPDYLDIDADDDGIVDNIEGQSTTDYRPPLNADDDSDGIDNQYDPDFAGSTPFTVENTDGVGEPDFRDLDSDQDGILDNIEGWDIDADGTPETVADGNDIDGDGLDDAYDTDDASQDPTNGQTPISFPDAQTPGDDRDWRQAPVVLDADGDGIIDEIDLDDDNDGVPDTVEGTGDTDGDGIPDSLDLDSDNDGIPDILEAGSGRDSDGDGQIDYPVPGDPMSLNDANNDGLDDEIAESPLPDADSDNDGVVDRLDLDADNDGIADIIEAGGTDENGDGQVDYETPGDSTTMVDVDQDGFIDTIDTDNNSIDGVGDGGTALPDFDNDGDLRANRLDLDSDNDGIYDVIESGGTDADNNGTADDDDDNVDNTASNGIPTSAGGGNTPTDTGNDGTPDYINLDSDEDGCSDANEAYNNANADGGDGGQYGTGTPADTDENGLVTAAPYDTGAVTAVTDATDASGCVVTDADGDGVLDEQEITDGTDPNDPCDFLIASITETQTGDYLAADCDGDGVTNGQEIEDGTNPEDPCDFVVANATETPSGDYLISDCDGDGVTNGTELNDGTDPRDPCEFNQDSVTLEQSGEWLVADCDNDTILNGQEITDGTDPNDPCSSRGGTPPSGSICDIIIDNDLVGPQVDAGFFRIANIESFPNNTVRIYNRWGILVYETTGYDSGSNNFKGLSQGRATIQEDKALPVGVYFYVIDYENNGDAKTKSGYLYVNR